MKTGRGLIWPWAGLVLIVAAAMVVVQYVFSAHDRDSASTLVSTLVSVATAATGVAVVRVTRLRRAAWTRLGIGWASWHAA